MRELKGRVAILTGASRGLGVHIARALAKEGVHLALAARSEEALASEVPEADVESADETPETGGGELPERIAD